MYFLFNFYIYFHLSKMADISPVVYQGAAYRVLTGCSARGVPAREEGTIIILIMIISNKLTKAKNKRKKKKQQNPTTETFFFSTTTIDIFFHETQRGYIAAVH